MRFVNLGVVVLAVACSKSDRPAGADSAPRDTAVSAPAPAAATANPAPAPGAHYVGLQYDSLPKGFTYRGGAIITPSPATRNAEYDVSHVSTPSGDMVWLDTLGAPVGKGLRAKIVRAELSIPPLAADERLFMASCDAAGKLDPLVVALVVNEPNTTRFTKIRQAWRVNIAAARFDVIPVAGVVCEDPGS